MDPFNPDTWPFPLTLLPQGAWLVGGSVRDRLLERRANCLDLDFVLANSAVETAETIARASQAGFVVLDNKRAIARVVFAQATADFAQQQGDTLEADLRQRDFTINAIAYEPHQGCLIDPLGGQGDIANQSIRMVSAENLAADPLRLLRAYRQAAQLQFSIAPETQRAIAKLAPQLQASSPERIRSELDALLSIPLENQRLQEIWQGLWQSQLLPFCLPSFSQSAIASLAAIDQATVQWKAVVPEFASLLQSWLKPVPAGCYRSWVKAAKLSRLLSPSLPQAEAELVNLKYSRSETQAVLGLIRLQPEIESLLQASKGAHKETQSALHVRSPQPAPTCLSRAQQFFLFKRAGRSFPATCLLATAQGAEIAKLQPLVARFLNPTDPIAHSQPLLSGQALMQQLKIKPGPAVGRWLEAIERAQAEGLIHSEQEAIDWLKARWPS